jgi:membrane protease YdiL (CAAX protease family)
MVSGDIMQDSGSASAEEAGSRLLAPLWHTVVVVVILLGFSALGARSHSAFGMRWHGHIVGYLTAAAFEWLTVTFVWFGLRLRGNRLGDLLGERWSRWRRVFADLGLAIIFLVGSNILLSVIGHLLRATPNRALRGLFPRGLAETSAFLFLSLTAGVCEEMICRGYLQRQFTALSKSVTAGVVIQGIIFGAAHGYQGLKYMVIISVYGCLFGAMAYWRRSLLPGMVAHFLQDGVLGLLLGQALKRTVLFGFLLG